jgi:hypothetical protein
MLNKGSEWVETYKQFSSPYFTTFPHSLFHEIAPSNPRFSHKFSLLPSSPGDPQTSCLPFNHFPCFPSFPKHTFKFILLAMVDFILPLKKRI